MHAAIGLTWILIKFLSWAGLALMLAGVVVFGRNLFSAATGGRESDVLSPLVWKGQLAILAFKLFGAGAGLQALSVFIAVVVPGRN